jgi:hypothetical protein
MAEVPGWSDSPMVLRRASEKPESRSLAASPPMRAPAALSARTGRGHGVGDVGDGGGQTGDEVSGKAFRFMVDYSTDGTAKPTDSGPLRRNLLSSFLPCGSGSARFRFDDRNLSLGQSILQEG